MKTLSSILGYWSGRPQGEGATISTIITFRRVFVPYFKGNDLEPTLLCNVDPDPSCKKKMNLDSETYDANLVNNSNSRS